MKHRIIWIDDSHTWFKSVVEDLTDCFSKKGFDTEIIHQTNYGDAKQHINDNYVDLIFLDFGLPDIKGDEIIIELRKSRCFAQIVFYSQESKNLKSKNGDDHFLHVVERENITDMFDSLAEQAYRKYHHPFFMRGLLLSEFIDLENCLDRLVSSFFDSNSDFFHEYMVYQGGEAFSFYAKAKFLQRILKNIEKSETAIKTNINEIGFTLNNFSEKVIKSRNVLAHAHPEFDESTLKIVLKSPISNVNFDDKWFHEKRVTIYRYKSKFGELEKLKLQTFLVAS